MVSDMLGELVLFVFETVSSSDFTAGCNISYSVVIASSLLVLLVIFVLCGVISRFDII